MADTRIFRLVFRHLAVVIAVGCGYTPAQSLRHIQGVVVDDEERPVADAFLDHTGGPWRAQQTDWEGKFVLETRAPASVIRKGGFRGELIRIGETGTVRVRLRKLANGPVFPKCGGNAKADAFATFRLPRVPGVIRKDGTRDIDYSARRYFVRKRDGVPGVIHGSGPMWTFGTPSDETIWGSVEYEDSTFDKGGPLTIVDAKGKLADGTRWRYLGQMGESVSYSKVDEDTAKILDQLFDGACLM